MKKQSILKKAAVLGLAAVMTVMSAGCGKTKTEQDGKSVEAVQTGIGGYVYVADYQNLSSGTDSYMDSVTIQGGNIYYSQYEWLEETQEGKQTFFRRPLEGKGKAEELPLQLNGQQSIMKFLVDKDENIILLIQEYEMQNLESSQTGDGSTRYYLAKYDGQGTELYRQDITDVCMESGDDYFYIQYAALDSENRIYAASEQTVFLFDADGKYNGSVKTADWINSMGNGKDGNVYITFYAGNGLSLCQVDYAAKALGQTYANVPFGNGTLTAGLEKDFLVNDGTVLYEYDMATQTAEPLLEWLDSDINGQYVSSVCVMEDGRLAAIIDDWSSSTSSTELAMLTRTDASKIKEKTIVTIGTLWQDSTLQSRVVNFNKGSEDYRIKIIQYYDDNSRSEDAYNDAVTALNNAITSNNGPDLINLSYVESIEALAAKGVLEDLNSYLDSSKKIKREEFLESILDAYTYNGVLTCIPKNFALTTVMGKTSMVGDKMGWTLDEMLQFVDAHQGAEIFEYASKESILQYCMSNNQNAFLDPESGECHFDSEDFRKVLEFSNRFVSQDEMDYADKGSTLSRLVSGELLLNQTGIYGVRDYVMGLEMFGGEEVTCIGFPTVDGSVGCMMNSYDSSYGISSKSQNKEAAWAFLEFLLSDDGGEEDMYYDGLPSRKDKLEKAFQEALDDMTYVLDENGDPVLDENGEPMKESHGGMSWEDGTSVEYYGATEEQIADLRELIAQAKPGSNGNSQVMQIILEEAAPFFKGQKSVEDVCNIIQSRVKLYISENR